MQTCKDLKWKIGENDLDLVWGNWVLDMTPKARLVQKIDKLDLSKIQNFR